MFANYRVSLYLHNLSLALYVCLILKPFVYSFACEVISPVEILSLRFKFTWLILFHNTFFVFKSSTSRCLENHILSRKESENLENDAVVFFKVYQKVFSSNASLIKNTFDTATNFSWPKNFQRLSCKERGCLTSFWLIHLKKANLLTEIKQIFVFRYYVRQKGNISYYLVIIIISYYQLVIYGFSKKDITDRKMFLWTVKLLLSDTVKHRERITLVEDDKILSEDGKVAKALNEFLSNVAKKKIFQDTSLMIYFKSLSKVVVA